MEIRHARLPTNLVTYAQSISHVLEPNGYRLYLRVTLEGLVSPYSIQSELRAWRNGMTVGIGHYRA